VSALPPKADIACAVTGSLLYSHKSVDSVHTQNAPQLRQMTQALPNW